MLSAFLVPFERAFCFQITEQHSKLSRALQDHGSYLASNGWTVTRANVPEIKLRDKTIYLRGDDGDKDLRVHRIWDLSNDRARDKYLNQINDALQEFVNFASTPSFSIPLTEKYFDASALNYLSNWKCPERGCWCKRDVMGSYPLGTVKSPKSNKVSSKPIIRA